MKYVIDTNALLSNPEVVEREDIIITSTVLRELEHLELKKMDRNLQYQIRCAKRAIKQQLKDGVELVDINDFTDSIEGGFSADYADNVIVEYARVNEFGIITNDVLMNLKAQAFGVEVLDLEDSKEDEEGYKGFIEKIVSREEFTRVFLNLGKNMYDLKVNQYVKLIDEDTGYTMDVLKWTGEWMTSISDKDGKVKSRFQTMEFGKFETKDEYQAMAVDSINNNQITMIRGKAGSGKSLIALNTAWRLVEQKEYKLVIFFNPVPSKDAIELGFYKGSMLEKAMSTALGSMLKSKFGSIDEVYNLIAVGKIDILPFVDLRGYETGDTNTVVWFTESQNLTSSLMKMGLQRISENTKVIVDGDFHQQVDKDVYISSNGMKRASEVLRGNELYGEVELQNVYRSRLASAVEEM